MTTLNSYATLAEFKNYATSRGIVVTPDVTDDATIELLLKNSSRYIDRQTGRHFYPFIETRYFSVPEADCLDPRALDIGADLLEVLSITNGDGVTIPSTEYTLQPRNSSPYYAIRLKDVSAYSWTSDAAGDTHDVIAVSAVWGCHDRYSAAWQTVTTANEAMDTSETGYDVTSNVGFVIGDLIRFDDELGYVSSVGVNTLTVTRGENGSTAATHLTSISVKVWRVMDDAKTAVLELSMNAYKRRFGQAQPGGAETVTAAGVVITPRDVPAMVKDFIVIWRRYQ